MGSATSYTVAKSISELCSTFTRAGSYAVYGPGTGSVATAGWYGMYLAVASSGVCETVVGSALEVGGCLISMRLMWRAAAASVNIFGAIVPLSTPGMALYVGGSLGCL